MTVCLDHTDTWGLVEATQTGDKAAFGQLFECYRENVFRYALPRVLFDQALAEDITQETFLRAWRAISKVRFRGSDIGAWFMGIAHNVVVNHIDSKRCRYERTVPDYHDYAIPAPGDIDELLMNQATAVALGRFIDQLLPLQRECIVRIFLAEQSIPEAAQEMGRTDGAIRILKHRALKNLARLVPPNFRLEG